MESEGMSGESTVAIYCGSFYKPTDMYKSSGPCGRQSAPPSSISTIPNTSQAIPIVGDTHHKSCFPHSKPSPSSLSSLPPTPPMSAATTPSSAPWANPASPAPNIGVACRTPGEGFQGVWGPSSWKGFCADYIWFSIDNLNDHDSFDLDNWDCYNQMMRIVEKCSARKGGVSEAFWGGELVESGWKFR